MCTVVHNDFFPVGYVSCRLNVYAHARLGTFAYVWYSYYLSIRVLRVASIVAELPHPETYFGLSESVYHKCLRQWAFVECGVVRAVFGSGIFRIHVFSHSRVWR